MEKFRFIEDFKFWIIKDLNKMLNSKYSSSDEVNNYMFCAMTVIDCDISLHQVLLICGLRIE